MPIDHTIQRPDRLEGPAPRPAAPMSSEGTEGAIEAWPALEEDARAREVERAGVAGSTGAPAGSGSSAGGGPPASRVSAATRLPPRHLLGLQRMAGNGAVAALVARNRTPALDRRTPGNPLATLSPVGNEPLPMPLPLQRMPEIAVQRDHHTPDARAAGGGTGTGAGTGGGSGVGAAPDRTEWSPVLFYGTAADVAAAFLASFRALHPATDTTHLLIVVSTGSHFVLFANGRRQGAYALGEGAAQLPAGVFWSRSGNVVQLMQHAVDNRQDWWTMTTESENRYVDMMAPDERERYLAAARAAMGTDGAAIYLRPAVVPGTATGGGERTGTGEGAGDTGEGGTGEGTAPPIPRWATLQFRTLRGRVTSERRRLVEMAGRNAGERDPSALDRLMELGAVPERVLLGSDGTSPSVQVRVGRRSGALLLAEGQDTDILWGRVQALTRVLHAGLAPTRRGRAEDLLLGMPGGTPPDEDTVPPNTEAYPSYLTNLGTETGISGSLHRFSMHIDWSVEGQWGTLAAFGPRRYQWDVIRLRTGSGSLAERGDSRRAGRGEAAGAELGSGMGEIAEDAEHSVDEELIDPGTAALMATDAGIRTIGNLVSSFITLASQPTTEQGVQWQGPGTYVVRCISARPPLDREDAPPNPVVRAPSVAFLPIRVITRADMANQLTAPTDLRDAEASLADLLRRLATASDEERPGIEAQITDARAAVARLRAADEAGMTQNLSSSDRNLDEQIALAQLLVRLRTTGSEPMAWRPDVERFLPATFRDAGMTADVVFGMVVGLHAQLALGRRSPETMIAELRRAQDQVRRQRTALSEVSGDFVGPVFRPHMGFVPRLQGRTLPLVTALAEHTGSREGRRRWTLVDLSTPGHHDSWDGYGRAAGAAGHAEAIRAAFRAMALDVPYGRGTLGIRLPAGISGHTQGPVDVPATMEARPGSGARWRQRLESLATAAGVAAMVVTGPAGVALGVMGAVAGGTVAAYRIHRRYEGGYLELDLETAMDITAVVGGLVAPAGAWAGGVRAGSRWVALADRVETSARVFGYLQMGGQVFVIPVTLARELQAIGSDPNLSPGERAARRAMAFLNATRSGLELAVGAYQAVADHPTGPRVREGGPPTGGEGGTVPGEGGSAPAEGGAVPAEGGATPAREGDATPAGEGEAPVPAIREVAPPDLGGLAEPPEPTTGGRPATRPDGEPHTGTREGAVAPDEGTARPVDETTRPGDRTAVGTGGGSRPARDAGGGDANPGARTRAVELLEQRIGSLREPAAEPGRPVTPEDLASRPRVGDEAVTLYDRVVHASGGNEVGLFYNPNTGEFAVRVGTEFSVGPPAGDGWQAVIHLHPNPENVVVRRLPAPADVLGAVHAAMRTGSHVEYVQSTRPDGSTGLARVEVTLNPPRIVVELPADPPSGDHPGEPARRIEVATPEAYAREYGSDATHMDPSSPIYEWVMRDLDDFYRRRRAEEPHDAPGRTAVGAIPTEPAGPATGEGGPATGGGGPATGERDGSPATGGREGGHSTAEGGGGPSTSGTPRPPTVREGVEGRRADVRARFAEADAAFAEAGLEGPSPSAAFDTAMGALERAGMGADGRAAIETMLQPGQGQPEISAGRLRRVVDALGRVAELVGQRPDLATSVGLDHVEGSLVGLARDLAQAYRSGETLDGRPIRSADAPELAEVMRDVNHAYDDYLAAGGTDPVERLLGLLRFRDAIARAGETLRSYRPEFRSTRSTGPATGSALVEGVPETTHTVRASGEISEPLARDLPGVGLEGYILTPRDLASLVTIPPGVGAQLAELLYGYHRAHLVGPGFGTELFEGIMLAPPDVNLGVQNEGVESFIRAASGAGVDVHLDTQASGRRLEVSLASGGVEHVDVLTRVEYVIRGRIEGGPEVTFRVVIEVGDPPAGATVIRSTIPPGAVGADVLAAFQGPQPAPGP